MLSPSPAPCQVVYGLPRLLTGSILAHEVMHAWLRLSGCTRLPEQVEEGLCQLMALLWLEAQADKVRGRGMGQGKEPGLLHIPVRSIPCNKQKQRASLLGEPACMCLSSEADASASPAPCSPPAGLQGRV